MNILISGASGFIGSALSKALKEQGHRVIPLVRRESRDGESAWDPEAGKIDLPQQTTIHGIINLAAENISRRRWNRKQKEIIRCSRVKGAVLLADTAAGLEKKPDFFISASAVGYYGDRYESPLDEDVVEGEGFLASVCRDWERMAARAADKGVRTCMLRFGLVLHAEGGVLRKLLPLFRLGLGVVPGGGGNYVPWITLDDTVNALLHVIARQDLKGPVNMVSPGAVRGKTFYRNLGRVLHRPVILPFPAIAVKAILGEMGEELMLKSQNVIPRKLLESGFAFRHPELRQALEHLLQSR